jgi:hypothetical protein
LQTLSATFYRAIGSPCRLRQTVTFHAPTIAVYQCGRKRPGGTTHWLHRLEKRTSLSYFVFGAEVNGSRVSEPRLSFSIVMQNLIMISGSAQLGCRFRVLTDSHSLLVLVSCGHRTINFSLGATNSKPPCHGAVNKSNFTNRNMNSRNQLGVQGNDCIPCSVCHSYQTACLAIRRWQSPRQLQRSKEDDRPNPV